VRCRQCKCSLVENPNFRSGKCHGCEKQMNFGPKVKDWTEFFHQCRSTICRETGWSAKRWHDNADAAGKRSHDGQSRDGRRIKLDLANIGVVGVSIAVEICEWETRWSRKFETMQWPAYWSNRMFFGAYRHRFHSKRKKGSLWWEARRCAWNVRFGMEQRRWHQDAVQPVEHQSTSLRKCVQQEWSSTGKTADAVGSAFQTAGRCGPCAFAGTRSACRNQHKLIFSSKDTERGVCENPSRVATLGRTPW